MLNKQEKQESLEILNYQIRSCESCSLSVTRKHALTGEGNIDARIMFVALSPGVKEDFSNRMFIGPSGQVFNKLLLTAGIDRDRVFMTNLVKCMLPNNRKPKRSEIEVCYQFLGEEILLIQPEVIVPLGYYAARTLISNYRNDLLKPNSDQTKVEFGKMLILKGQKIYPLFHPASLLYNPSYEADTIEKYKELKLFL